MLGLVVQVLQSSCCFRGSLLANSGGLRLEDAALAELGRAGGGLRLRLGRLGNAEVVFVFLLLLLLGCSGLALLALD